MVSLTNNCRRIKSVLGGGVQFNIFRLLFCSFLLACCLTVAWISIAIPAAIMVITNGVDGLRLLGKL